MIDHDPDPLWYDHAEPEKPAGIVLHTIALIVAVAQTIFDACRCCIADVRHSVATAFRDVPD